MVVHAFNASVQKAKATRSLSWSTEQVARESGLHRATQRILSQKERKKKERKRRKKVFLKFVDIFILILLHDHHHKNKKSSSAMTSS